MYKFKQIERLQVHINSFTLKYPIYKGVFILGSGTILSQIIAFLTMPTITRLYMPSDFGLLATYTSILSVLVVASSFTLNSVLVLPKDLEEATGLFWLCIILLISTSIGLLMIIFFAGNSLMQFFHLDAVHQSAWLLLVGFFGYGLYQTLNYWTLRNRDYKTITYTNLMQGISGPLTKIILGLLIFGPLGLIIGFIVSQVVGVETFARKIWKNDWNELKKIKLEMIAVAAIKYYKFICYNFPARIINSLSSQLPVFMILAAYGTHTVGLYSLAYTLLVLPANFISTSIDQAFMGDASKLIREGKELRSLYLSTIRHMSLISVPLIGFIALISPLIIPFLFGKVWSEAGYLCLPLTLMVIPQFIFAPTSKLYIYGYESWSLLLNIARIVAVFIGFYISHQLMLTIIKTLTIYGLIILVIYLIEFWLNLKAIARLNIRMQDEKSPIL